MYVFFISLEVLVSFWLGFDTSGLSTEDMMKLNSGLDYILDIVGETIHEPTIKVFIFDQKNIFEGKINVID